MTQSEIDQAFSAFWAVYPRRKNRKAAFIEFQKAIKHTSPGEIIDGAKRYAQDVSKNETPEIYVAHARTWLFNERWTDENGLNIPEQEHISPEESRKRARLNVFEERGFWKDEWGPRPQDSSNVVDLFSMLA